MFWLAKLYQADILVKVLPVPSFPSFECLTATLAGSTQLQVFLIYHTPKIYSVIMSELSELLTSICSLFPATVQLGDFNIHANSSRSSFATEFLSLADCLNFTHHVKCLSMSEVTCWIWFSPLALPLHEVPGPSCF